MTKTINAWLKIPLLFLFAGILLVQCDKSDPPVQRDSIDATLAKSSDLTIFTAAVKQAKLETFTKGPGPFTILAPTDAALTAAGITASALPLIDSITLTALVLNHFQSSAAGTFTARTSFEIPEGPNGPMASIAGYTTYSYKDKVANAIYINGAMVSERDIYCSNGIIHKIDKALNVPNLTMLATLTASSDYSLMVAAITKTGLTSTFSPSTSAPSTVFAIPNSVMFANGYDASTITGLSGAALTTLSNILKYHVVASRNFSNALKAGNLKTVYGTNVVVSRSGGVYIKGTSNPSPFQITPTDYAASNGVIHVITGMLKP